jgi:hypothetical protein
VEEDGAAEEAEGRICSDDTTPVWPESRVHEKLMFPRTLRAPLAVRVARWMTTASQVLGGSLPRSRSFAAGDTFLAGTPWRAVHQMEHNGRRRAGDNDG